MFTERRPCRYVGSWQRGFPEQLRGASNCQQDRKFKGALCGFNHKRLLSLKGEQSRLSALTAAVNGGEISGLISPLAARGRLLHWIESSDGNGDADDAYCGNAATILPLISAASYTLILSLWYFTLLVFSLHHHFLSRSPLFFSFFVLQKPHTQSLRHLVVIGTDTTPRSVTSSDWPILSANPFFSLFCLFCSSPHSS